MKCQKCKRNYPDRLINNGNFNGEWIDCCPICALKMRNEIHGLPPETPFNGEIAQGMYDEAVAYAKKHGYAEVAP